VLDSPAVIVTAVSAVTRRNPHQRVSAANAGLYSVPTSRAPRGTAGEEHRQRRGLRDHHQRGTASTGAVVITTLGPIRSSHPPTAIPVSAEVI